MYGYICPVCGSRLDPGERCDCLDLKRREREELEETYKKLLVEGKNGQLKLAV